MVDSVFDGLEGTHSAAGGNGRTDEEGGRFENNPHI